MAVPDANPSRHVAFLKQSCGFSTQARNSTCCRKAIRTTNPATLAASARRVLVGPRGAVILALGCFLHTLTIVVVWALGRAQGFMLPVTDAAVLFTVMVGVQFVPISISGWGLRELAMISLLGTHGIAPERALLFSVCFGLVYAVGSLPGALIWLLYSFASSSRTAQHDALPLSRKTQPGQRASAGPRQAPTAS